MKRHIAASLLICAALLPLRAETPTERWVRQKIKDGQEADLNTLSQDPSGRVLSADFLGKILGTKSEFVNSKGISIQNAVVLDSLDLSRLEAWSDIELSGFEFRRSVDLSGARFHRTLFIERSVFKDRLDGYRLAVDGDLSLNWGLFEQPINLSFAVIGGTFAAHHAEFKGLANVTALRVGGRGSFNDSRFADDALFTLATFTSEVSFTNSSFTKPTGQAIFNSMKIDYLAIFDGATFASDADFGHTYIGSNFQARGMKFTGAQHSAKFHDMKVGKFILEDSSFEPVYVDMNGLTATELKFRDVRWPIDPDRFTCESVVYDRIDVEAKGKPALEGWPEVSQYSPTVYAQLAGYFDKRGDRWRASDVRINRQWREATTLGPLARLGNLLLYVTCGYGERLWIAFVWMAAFVAIGWWVFRHKSGMELIDQTKTLQPEPAYNPFWFSLGLFLPVVDIGLIHTWRPSYKRRAASNYAQVHVLLGWLLVPIALASITGILK